MTDETKGDGITLEQAIASAEVRNEMRGDSGRYPNGKVWGHCYGVDGFWLPKAAWKTIKEHLAAQSAMRVDVGNADPLTPANSHDQEITSRRIGWMLESTDGKGWWTGRQIWDFTKDPNNAAVFTESAARFRESIFNGAAIATEHVWLGKEQSAMRVDEAFERGWRTACDWAKRPDMIYDIGSPAYERDKRAALQAAIGGKE